jgi:four helix bundle protein
MKYDLEDRLVRYAVSILEVVEKLPENKGASHLGNQLVRSGTAPALMFGEATGAESRKDFIHKMKLALKELRESLNCLKIIYLKKYLNNVGQLDKIIQENHELISIFVKSIQTAKKNLANEKVA